MFTFISNISIFRRLSYAFLLAALVPGIIISVLGITFINVQTTRSQMIQMNMNMTKDTMQLSVSLQRNKDLLSELVALYKTQGMKPNRQTQTLVSTISGIQQDIETTIKQYPERYQLANTPQMSTVRNTVVASNPDSTLIVGQQTAIALAAKLWPTCQDAQVQVFNGIRHANNINTLVPQANTRCDAAQTAWASVTQLAGQISMIIAQADPSQNNPIIFATIVAFLATVLIIVMIGYTVNRTIAHPLRQLTTLTTQIAQGETKARVEILGRDELYMVASSMNTMLDNIVHLIQETQSRRDILQAQVEKLVSEVSGVGEGDLRVQPQVTRDALGVLADSFNYMVEELGGLVVRVKTVAHEVENSTTVVLDRMTQLVERGDIQIKQIAGAAAEVEQMAISDQQVAERTQRLYDVAHIARQDAQIGRESVQQTIEGMGRINENVQATASKVQALGDNSREINEIVEAISSIAHQTNRLALDAAIQAAMAGENGKGFGAVAADIRRLAERAKDQAGKITNIVRSVREDIGAVAVSMQDTERETTIGAKLTQEAGIALESIFAAVEHQAHEVESINQVAMQQLQASSTVVQIMQDISQATQENGLSTREASHNMERLTRLVEQLRSSVEAFKLREDQDYASSSHSAVQGENIHTFSGLFRTVTATIQSVQSAQQFRLPRIQSADNLEPLIGSPFEGENKGTDEENTFWEWGTLHPQPVQPWGAPERQAPDNQWVKR